ncbi:heterokaryon incompatibility protein [Fusarium tjaetaba]|uniref:Heterokaryon incompatibility protein n=1 Tax=Fusarium tjaetaba TaxID=1567544 RepID=A0A8H5Q7B5_9HYPO|nr:heterokaryon incompatibility protein [Fusarium tjaetaba]KAF5609969.1 heterokaryon incompatibility protein [Fusarium tjaetaba]
MDILPVPSYSKHPVIEVRLLQKPIPYDDLPYPTYPERQGWLPRSLEEWERLFKRPTQALCAFLEEWLLLVPLPMALNCLVDTEDAISCIDLVDDTCGYPVFTLKKIQKQIQQLSTYKMSDVVMMRPESMNNFLVAVNENRLLHNALLDYGERYVDNDPDHQVPEILSIDDFIRSKKAHDPRSEEVIVATDLMLDLMASILDTGMEARTLGLDPGFPRSWGSPLWRWMLHDRWCPSDLARLFGHLPTACILFLYNMGPPKPNEDHPMIRITKPGTSLQLSRGTSDSRRSLCTVFKCAHRQLIEDEYERKHVEGCQGCQDVAADPEDLHRIIERGKIPLILSIDEEDSSETVVFIEAEPDIAYVAISHVWSDGLGNPQRNALPRCQLLRLSKLIRNLPGQHQNIILFWCDTLCIPPDSAGASDTQALAIGQMRNIYFDASAVLVLDSSLYNYTIRERSYHEILFKIISCSWNTRLWTYQEGALAKSLIFQFSDMPYDLDVNISCLQQSGSPIERACLDFALFSQYTSLRGFRKLQSQHERLEAASVAFCYRTTSVETDEALCLATLLDLNATEIAHTQPELRMAKLWNMMPKIPSDILFQNLACLPDAGLSWAPRTFLASRLNAYGNGTPLSPVSLESQDGRLASLSGSGLLVEYQGFCFCIGDSGFGSFFYLRIEQDWFYVHCGVKDLRVWGYRNYGIITSFDPNLLREYTSLEVLNDRSKGVLVGITDVIHSDTGNPVYLCQKLATCIVEKSTAPGFARGRYIYKGFRGYSRRDPMRFLAGDAKQTPYSQLWQIS